MNPKNLRQLVKEKRAWAKPLSAQEKAQGFKGWYVSKNLPHRDAPGTRQFITCRLADSLPPSRRHEWEALLELEDDHEKQRGIEAYIDRGYGKCHLRNPRIAALVQENLWHHDGEKYRLLAWVIMPNHFHILIDIWQVPMGEILKSWKSYTAKEANKILGRSGAFWEEDYFDRYVRDDDHYRRVVRYIENNPNKAKLIKSSSDWLWSSARYRGESGPVVPMLTHPTAKRMPSSGR